MAGERVVMLEAMSHRKFEFRPQLSLLSLTNPLSLVTGLGLSFLGGTGGTSPVVLLSARLDLLESEVARDRQRFQLEAETTQRFYELAGRQQSAELYCATLPGDDASALTRKLKVGQVTKIEVLRRQQAQLDQEAVCRGEQRELQLAELRLAKLVGLPAEGLRVTEEPVAMVTPTRVLLPAAKLVDTAFARREGMTTLDRNVAQMSAEIAALRERRGIQVSLFSSRPALASAGSFQPPLTAALALGRDVSFEFEKRLLQMHFKMVDDDLDRLKKEMAEHLVELRIQCVARQQEADAAVRRSAIAAEFRLAIEARWKAGLETSVAVADAVAEERRARVELARTRVERESAYSAILSLCGIHGEPQSGEESALVASNTGR